MKQILNKEDKVMITSIVELCNSDKVKKICEPRVFQPRTITEFDVNRVIVSLEIYLETLDKVKRIKDKSDNG